MLKSKSCYNFIVFSQAVLYSVGRMTLLIEHFNNDGGRTILRKQMTFAFNFSNSALYTTSLL